MQYYFAYAFPNANQSVQLVTLPNYFDFIENSARRDGLIELCMPAYLCVCVCVESSIT